MINIILQSLLLDLLNINFYAKVYPFMSCGLFSLFQDLQLVITLTNDKCNFAISSARSCQYQSLASVDVFRVVQFPFQFYCYRIF